MIKKSSNSIDSLKQNHKQIYDDCMLNFQTNLRLLQEIQSLEEQHVEIDLNKIRQILDRYNIKILDDLLKYEVLKTIGDQKNKIGKGGTATAYQIDFRNQSLVIKLFDTINEQDQFFKDKFLNSIREIIILSLECQFYPKITGYDIIEGLHKTKIIPEYEIIIVMEMCLGNMEQAIYRNYDAFNIYRAIGIILECCWGTKVLQKYKVIHADIGLDNIFVSQSIVSSKLADFGCSIFLNLKEMKKPEQIQGKTIFTAIHHKKGIIPPEFREFGGYRIQSDIYMIGCCLNKLIQKFQSPKRALLLLQKINSKFLIDRLSGIVQQCCYDEPAKRIKIDSLIDLLYELLDLGLNPLKIRQNGTYEASWEQLQEFQTQIQIGALQDYYIQYRDIMSKRFPNEIPSNIPISFEMALFAVGIIKPMPRIFYSHPFQFGNQNKSNQSRDNDLQLITSFKQSFSQQRVLYLNLMSLIIEQQFQYPITEFQDYEISVLSTQILVTNLKGYGEIKQSKTIKDLWRNTELLRYLENLADEQELQTNYIQNILQNQILKLRPTNPLHKQEMLKEENVNLKLTICNLEEKIKELKNLLQESQSKFQIQLNKKTQQLDMRTEELKLSQTQNDILIQEQEKCQQNNLSKGVPNTNNTHFGKISNNQNEYVINSNTKNIGKNLNQVDNLNDINYNRREKTLTPEKKNHKKLNLPNHSQNESLSNVQTPNQKQLNYFIQTPPSTRNIRSTTGLK